jgi:hypothetical protein
VSKVWVFLGSLALFANAGEEVLPEVQAHNNIQSKRQLLISNSKGWLISDTSYSCRWLFPMVRFISLFSLRTA